ncbi:efflux RND transporter periplasmic adaptor subunit [Microvirga alba]|uniref:Efflux RND transporter periplasmic adaptor subunit n=1 Tax=Microvirga alba TaxID=2791025 RepID=A0A931FPY9_9HYPH|nr:efflux RND transporter periplasmic adaptor subunit [Microvirga alba]MBF9235444.1 efflux RND transporter periplasmic adaptor subunit [Microvirga alba]
MSIASNRYRDRWASTRQFLALAAILMLTSACQGNVELPAGEGRPVRVLTVKRGDFGDVVALTGEVQAEQEVSLAFRIAGRVIELAGNVGDRVEAGQLLARLDPQTEQNALRAAEATLRAAQGQVTKTQNTFERQQGLLAQGFTTRPRFDEAQQALQTARAQLENAEAQVDAARDQLGFMELRADAEGVVTARKAEAGEVVQAGQTVLQLARAEGRDAVFDVPARLLHMPSPDATISVALADNPMVTASGRVREVSPQADPVTRTFRVRVGISHPPEAMRLGSTVTGSLALRSTDVIRVPARALTQSGREPAVWVVDPATSNVSLRNVEILRHDARSVVIARGLEPGEIIVTAGIQALHPGQRIRALPADETELSGMPLPAAKLHAAFKTRTKTARASDPIPALVAPPSKG